MYEMIDQYAFYCKNVYNFGNYLIRQELANNHKFYSEYDLSKLIIGQPCCNGLMVQTVQQTVKLLHKCWKSYFKSHKDWKIHPEKYMDEPKPPNFKHKCKGRCTIVFTNQNCKYDGEFIIFPKCFNQFKLKTNIEGIFNQVRIIKDNLRYRIEVIYSKPIKSPVVKQNRYICMDLGVNNLCTIISNVDAFTPIIINGKIIKSRNKYYNKLRAHYQSIAKTMNNQNKTNRINQLDKRRNNIVNDFIHKVSRYILELAIKNNIDTIVIGLNQQWKTKCNMGTKNNQTFVQIPHSKLIDLIKYKAYMEGIHVIVTEESYTSGTSFLDNELPVKENYNKQRRIHRGLFKSNNGILINADVNAAYQILKKVTDNINYINVNQSVQGSLLNPIRVTII